MGKIKSSKSSVDELLVDGFEWVYEPSSKGDSKIGFIAALFKPGGISSKDKVAIPQFSVVEIDEFTAFPENSKIFHESKHILPITLTQCWFIGIPFVGLARINQENVDFPQLRPPTVTGFVDPDFSFGFGAKVAKFCSRFIPVKVEIVTGIVYRDRSKKTVLDFLLPRKSFAKSKISFGGEK